jgi:hypothetical protein
VRPPDGGRADAREVPVDAAETRLLVTEASEKTELAGEVVMLLVEAERVAPGGVAREAVEISVRKETEELTSSE